MTQPDLPEPMVPAAPALATVLRTARVAPEKADFRPALPLRSLPGVNGTHMGTMSYREQLLHPNWQRKRLETLESSGWACEACESTSETLHVHHRRYIKGRMVWEYERDDLQVLCSPCHQSHHDAEGRLQRVLLNSTLSGYGGARHVEEIAAALTAGFVDGDIGGKVDEGAIEEVMQGQERSLFLVGSFASVLCLATVKHAPALAALLRQILQDTGLHSGPAAVEQYIDRHKDQGSS